MSPSLNLNHGHTLEWLLELQGLYADYAAALDDRRYADWVDLFADDCSYRLQARENHDRGLPLCTLHFESKGMLRDRIYGIENTLFHQPYYQRHVIGPLRLVQASARATPLESMPTQPDSAQPVPESMPVQVEANYSVFRTRRNELTEVFNVGRYIDRVVREGGRLKFADKHVVFDSEMIPNSIIYPL